MLEHELVRLHRHESAAHLTPAGEPAAHALADRPAELALLAEDAIQPGGGHFEIVGPFDDRGRVEHVPDLPAEPFAVPDPDTAGLVDEETQDPARTERAPLDVDQLEPVVTQHRYHDLLDLDLVGLHRVVHGALPCPWLN